MVSFFHQHNPTLILHNPTQKDIFPLWGTYQHLFSGRSPYLPVIYFSERSPYSPVRETMTAHNLFSERSTYLPVICFSERSPYSPVRETMKAHNLFSERSTYSPVRETMEGQQF